jgi:SH3-like domain-containing protein
MLRILIRPLAAAAILVCAAGAASADPVVPGEEHCVVNVRSDDRLNLRAAPSAQARIVGRLRYADCGVTITAACQGSWCPVDDGHYAGWAHRRYLAMVSPARYCVVGVAPGDRLSLRAFPSPDSRILTRLGRRQCGISFLPYRVGAWQKIRAGGWEGWAHSRYLSGQ